MKRFHRKAYRCLDCGWRGTVTVQVSDGQLSQARRRSSGSPRKIPWLTVIIIALLVALLLIFYITREPEPASVKSPPSLSPSQLV
ncbi:MAG: hypothetical protein WCO26_13975 [Deltaproteobacteria bacterium]